MLVEKMGVMGDGISAEMIPAVYGDQALPLKPPEPSWDIAKAYEQATVVMQIEAEIDGRVRAMAEDHMTRREQVVFTDSSGAAREVSQRRFVRLIRREKAIRERMVAAHGGKSAVAAYQLASQGISYAGELPGLSPHVPESITPAMIEFINRPA